jgi:hypothetical protein
VASRGCACELACSDGDTVLGSGNDRGRGRAIEGARRYGISDVVVVKECDGVEGDLERLSGSDALTR